MTALKRQESLSDSDAQSSDNSSSEYSSESYESNSTDISDSGSDSDAQSVLNVDFEFLDLREDHFHMLKYFLQKFISEESLSVSDLADAVLSFKDRFGVAFQEAHEEKEPLSSSSSNKVVQSVETDSSIFGFGTFLDLSAKVLIFLLFSFC